MNRSTRIALILGAAALVGVVALGWMAQRYATLLAAPKRTAGGASGLRELAGEPSVTALEKGDTRAVDPATLREIERFIAVRRELRDLLDSIEPTRAAEARVDAWAEHRSSLLVYWGMSLDRYLEVRKAYRRWRTAGADPQDGLHRAMESRRQELKAVDLGDYEELDP